MGASGIFDQYIEKEKQKLKRAGAQAAKEIGSDIHNIFRSSVDRWYADYNAASRGYHLQEIDYGVRGKNRYSYTLGDNEFLCGIYVDPSYMDGNPYEKTHGRTDITPSWVFDLSYLRGIHGFTEDMVAGHNEQLSYMDGKKWNPPKIPGASRPPDEEIEERFNEYTEDRVKSIVYKYMGR